MRWGREYVKANEKRYQCFCTEYAIEATHTEYPYTTVFRTRANEYDDPPDNDETRQHLRDMEVAIVAHAYGVDPEDVNRAIDRG